MKVHFTANGWNDYLHWWRADPDAHRRLIELIEDIWRRPFTGLGKPEPLRGELSGWWSRRLTAEHRVIHRVQGRKGEDQRLEIIQCRYHYGRG
jgi:toxin YoeB